MVIVIKVFLTIEWPRYSAALSDMYNSFPVWVAIIKKPLSACNKRSRSYGPFLCSCCFSLKISLRKKIIYIKVAFS